MSRLLAHLTMPATRVEGAVARIVAAQGLDLPLELRPIGADLCAASGYTHDVMRLIGGLADEGEAVLLNVEAC